MTINEFAKEYYGLKPPTFRTKDENKLRKQREKIVGICPICKRPMGYITGTNIVACINPKCKGKEYKVPAKDGTEITKSIPIFRLLSSNMAQGADSIFSE